MSADGDLRVLRNLQRLLDEGQFTSTYKFALLQALADLSVERDPGSDGALVLPVADIAGKFIEYYWRQALPYGAVGDSDRVALAPLRQNTDRQATIISLILAARSRHDGTLASARQDARAWSALVRKVATVIRQMPLWKLQTIGRSPCEFLYRRAEFAGDRIRLLPGVPGALRNFHGLVTHLIRGAWVDQVQRIPGNRPLLGDTPNLAEFLFGVDRQGLAGYREILRHHQAGRCFYCEGRVQGEGDLDHFVAWSRYPVDLGHNFVFAHPRCNAAKRDYLAHPRHLRRWREQNLDDGDSLAARFSQANLASDRERSRRIALWAYEQGEAGGAHAWLAGDELRPLGPDWRRAMGSYLLDRVAEERPGY